jgi:hypothetical protein
MLLLESGTIHVRDPNGLITLLSWKPAMSTKFSHTFGLRCLAVLIVFSLNGIFTNSAWSAEPPLPDWKKVQTAVQSQLAKQTGYRKGDLLSQGRVAPLFPILKKLGWSVADQKEIQKSLLSDGDFLVVQLRSSRGRSFMRKIAKSRSAYDRLDRLRRLPYGKRRVREIIRSRGGHTLILYMTKTKGGKNLGNQLSRIKSGRNFNQSTGRIYTEKSLLARLEKSYQAEVKRHKAAGKNKK